MRIMVTGATGFLGGHIAEALRHDGHDVVALVRPGSDTQLLENLGVELLHGEVTSADDCRRAVQGVDAVVHSAVKVGDWGDHDDYRKVNVAPVRWMLEECRQRAAAGNPLKRFVLISSLGVYEARDHFGTTEQTPLPKQHIDGYTQTKKEADELAQTYQAAGTVPVVILRPGFVYGPRDRTVLPRIVWNLRSYLVAYFGSRKKILNHVYVGNVVLAVQLALEKDQAVGQVYNVTDVHCQSKATFFGTIADRLGVMRPLATFPLAMGKGLGWCFMTLNRLTGVQPLLSPARLKFLGLNLDYSTEEIQRELGYEPIVTLREGLQQTFAWMEKEGLLKRQ